MKKHHKEGKEKVQAAVHSGPRDLKWLALAVTLLYFIPSLGMISKTTFWAFSVNTYLSHEFIIVHILLIAACCTALFMPNLLRPAGKIPPAFHYILFACAMILMAVFLREAVPFYGDGYFFQRDISTGLPVKYAEVLSTLIYKAVYLVMPGSMKTGATVYRVVNTTCVIPAVIVLSRFASRVRHEYRPFVFLTFLGFGSNVLFFGHIENYTLCFVAMLAYLYVITKPAPNMPIKVGKDALCLQAKEIFLEVDLIFEFQEINLVTGFGGLVFGAFRYYGSFHLLGRPDAGSDVR